MARKIANVQAVLEECILTSTAEGAEKKKQSSLESDQLADDGIDRKTSWVQATKA